MEGCKRLLLLFVGLHWMICNVTSVRLLGNNPLRPGEDLSTTLERLKTRKAHLDIMIRQASYPANRLQLQREFDNVDAWIDLLEETSQVPYKDYLKAVAEQKALFEREKAQQKSDSELENAVQRQRYEIEEERLRKKLEQAEVMRAQVIDTLRSVKDESQEEINFYRKQLKELTEGRDRIAQQYDNFIEAHNEQQQVISQEANQLKKEREEMMHKLKEAQNLHSQALEAMVVATLEGFKTVHVPYQDSINKLRDRIFLIASNGDEQQQIYSLLSTQTELEDLLDKLYEESELPVEIAHEDLEHDLAKMQQDVICVRSEHEKQRKEILDQIRSKGLGDYNEEEVKLLHKANQEVAETDKSLYEIARRNAYLQALSQVADLVEECENTIKDAEEKKALKKGITGKFLVKGKGLQPIANLADAKDQPVGFKGFASLTETQTPKDQQTKQLSSYEEADIIHQKCVLYRDVLELYRTRLSTEIVNGLTKVNKRLPVQLPGCSVSGLKKIRDELNEWTERVQYALRLSKELYKGDNRSMIVKVFSRLQTYIRNAILYLVGRKIIQEGRLEDDEEVTSSMETFDEQESEDFNIHYRHVRANLIYLLDIESEFSEEQLKEFRYNFIYVKKVSDVLDNKIQRVLEEGQQTRLASVKSVKEEMRSYEEKLHQLFSVSMVHVKSTIEKKSKEYETTLEEFKQCRYNLLKNFNLFKSKK